MANVQFGGLITGLDTKELIAGLVAAESRPITNMTGQKTVLQARGAVYTALAGALGGLKSAAQGLSLGSDFNKRAVSSSDATVLTVSADSTAQLGNTTVTVDRLAKAQSIQSVTFAGETASIGTGTLTLNIGTAAATIKIDTTNNTLAGLRTAINSSGAKVNAAVINIGSSTDSRLSSGGAKQRYGCCQRRKRIRHAERRHRSFRRRWRDRANRSRFGFCGERSKTYSLGQHGFGCAARGESEVAP